MIPGSWLFLGTLVIAALIGGSLPNERLRMIAALALLAIVLIEHLVLARMASTGGMEAAGGLVFIFVMAAAFGASFGIGVRLVVHCIKTSEFSRIALATLVTLILDVALAVLLP